MIRRPLLIVVLLAALIGGMVADHFLGSGSVPPAAATPPAIPTLAAAGSLTHDWFCPALPATGGGVAVGRIIVANPSAAPLSGSVTVVPASGSPTAQNITVAPYTRSTIKLDAAAPGAYAAATVALTGIVGGVEQEVQGTLGQSIVPCATTSSDQWYFAAGRTDSDATELLSLYNPYPATAIADLSFATDLGPTAPDLFQGIVVPGGGFNVVDVGAQVRIRAAVAASVLVRSGRLVVDKLQEQSGSAPHGLSLVLGATAPGTTWYFPDGSSGPGINEHFEIYNPGTLPAQVSLAPALAAGSATPFALTVPPDDRISLAVGQQARIPPGIAEAWTLTSTNGVGVVAERVIEAGAPSPHNGVSDSMGSPVLAREWVFPAGSAVSGSDEWVVLYNPSHVAAHVTVAASGAGGAPQSLGNPGPLVVAPGARTAIQIGKVFPQGVVVLDVTSDVPIVAERGQYVVGGQGMSDSIGIAGA